MIFNYDVSDLLQNAANLNVDEATTIPDSTDYDTLITPGNYVCVNQASAQTMTNQPTGTAHRLYVIQNVASDRITQIALVNSDTAKFLMRTLTSGGWNSWTEPSYRVQSQLTSKVEVDYTATQSYSVGDFLAVNANLFKVTSSISNGGTITSGTNASRTYVTDELKALNSFVNGAERSDFAISANTTKNYTMPNSSAGVLLILGAASTALELVIYRTSSSGTVNYVELNNASGITLSKSTNKLTIANSSSYSPAVIFLDFGKKTITETT